ncbi:hypothetical protein CC85DRAFT_288867 [Cutaneotrichosporon oleaginosum]|uniref:Uncharacterized protein n=1 Tax=Cutaneotrichosporon oleaginosum TaxID=879819 RepID=A0A0J0XDK7_9TREE|nr:uncharacterized protein CC85DRAFT_288867 [Cutaneotrichosporon oleaginosum]KLT39152.1 hypothetical protein CC85DRAFT_288867 [Cutaneotrichosporon oleaginosum]TXT11335.1 hypothetical protein COLE_01745 [Cutaneotrichosporon oleaginosum]
MSTVPQDWNLHLKYPGIELRKRSGSGLSAAARVLALVTWQGMHHYRVRWAIVFNGNTAMVAYLAKQHTMFLSKPFGREGDKGLTLASALFALAVMKHGSDSARPMGTMRDNSLSFLPRPSGALIYSQWEMVCDNCEWAVKDTQLFRDAAEFPDSSESESGSEVNV